MDGTGPNVRKLIALKASQILCGSKGKGSPVEMIARSLSTPSRLVDATREATEWADMALEVVRSSPDNTLHDDEAIAGAILEAVDEQRRKVTP